MRPTALLLVALGLAACAPAVPDSGVGFQDYPSYLRDREAALTNGTPPPAAPGAMATPAPVFSTERLGAAIDAAEAGVPAAQPFPAQPSLAQPYPAQQPPLDGSARPRGNAPAGIKVESGEMLNRSGGISDENDFSAVAARETIESDAERIARNRAQYQVVTPTAVPERSGSAGPNIVQFALSTTHAPGTPVYKRSSLRVSNPAAACARYNSPDLAQEAFLEDGGPERDRKGLDPDGDGFACSWDPRPFRTALK
ncbi:hypothetical protein RNZ50_16945 [Paracoccaceae bacterium Fryx2]|nr:hypothetical protein [Paracoccaceae bacterium Fryx2]